MIGVLRKATFVAVGEPAMGDTVARQFIEQGGSAGPISSKTPC